MNSKDYDHLVSLAKELSARGYTVVRFDPIGTWESEGNIVDYTTTQTLEDAKNVLEEMLKQHVYTNILFGGHSHGGMIALLYAARDKRISAVLGIMPSSNRLPDDEDRREWKKAGARISLRNVPGTKEDMREYAVPYSHIEDRDTYNIVKDVKNVRVPIILLAGELDDLVLPDDVKEIFDSANEPKVFEIIPGIQHDYRKNDEEIRVVNERIMKLLADI